MRPERFRELKQIVVQGLNTFVEVGTALAEIRDEHGYRYDHYETFEEFCLGEFDVSRSYAYKMIDASRVSTIVHKAGLPTPANEAQARELVRLSAKPEALVETWRAVSSNGPVTAEKVKLAVADKWVELYPSPQRPESPAPELQALACSHCCPVHCL
jgi:hypothetical protein